MGWGGKGWQLWAPPQQDPSPPGAVPASHWWWGWQVPRCAAGPRLPLVRKIYKYRGCMYTSYVYMYIWVAASGVCAGAAGTLMPGPSLVPGVAVEGTGLDGAARRGVEDGHAAAAGADDVGDEAGAVAADVAQDGALGVDVGELLFHPAPARAWERAAAQGTLSAPWPQEEEEEGGGRLRAAGLTGRSLSSTAAGLWPAASPGGSQSPARRQGCEPASWKASSSAGCVGVRVGRGQGWGRGREGTGRQ